MIPSQVVGGAGGHGVTGSRPPSSTNVSQLWKNQGDQMGENKMDGAGSTNGGFQEASNCETRRQKISWELYIKP
jgi:hypothetical protein